MSHHTHRTSHYSKDKDENLHDTSNHIDTDKKNISHRINVAIVGCSLAILLAAACFFGFKVSSSLEYHKGIRYTVYITLSI